MPNLPYSIELHDSRLAEIRREGMALVFRFSPAYIHRNGKGWSQVAELIVGGAGGGPMPDDLPVRVSDGKLETARGPYHNLLMLPLCDDGPVLLEIELDSGFVLCASGETAEVRLFGEPEFVEDFA